MNIEKLLDKSDKELGLTDSIENESLNEKGILKKVVRGIFGSSDPNNQPDLVNKALARDKKGNAKGVVAEVGDQAYDGIEKAATAIAKGVSKIKAKFDEKKKKNQSVKESYSSDNFNETTLDEIIAGETDNMRSDDIDKDLKLFNRIKKELKQKNENEIIVLISDYFSFDIYELDENTYKVEMIKELNPATAVYKVADDLIMVQEHRNGKVFDYFASEEDADRFKAIIDNTYDFNESLKESSDEVNKETLKETIKNLIGKPSILIKHILGYWWRLESQSNLGNSYIYNFERPGIGKLRVHTVDNIVDKVKGTLLGDKIDYKKDNESLNESSNSYGDKAWKLNEIISSMNNEDAYYGGWLYIWPDGESYEDALEDFGDKESYQELENTFIRTYKKYHRDGLFRAKEDTIENAHKWDEKLGLPLIKDTAKESEEADDFYETFDFYNEIADILDKNDIVYDDIIISDGEDNSLAISFWSVDSLKTALNHLRSKLDKNQYSILFNLSTVDPYIVIRKK